MRIRVILVRIRIRILVSVPLTNGSGCGSRRAQNIRIRIRMGNKFGLFCNLPWLIVTKLSCTQRTSSKAWSFQNIIFFSGTITLWAISRDILRGPRLFWRGQKSRGPLKMSATGFRVCVLQPRCAADFSLLNLPKGKSLGRSKPATSSYAQAPQHTVWIDFYYIQALLNCLL